jgi:hypothetical protein
MVPYRKPGIGKQPSMRFSGGPSKQRLQQWHMGRRHSARFICGLCHHHFSRRANLNRHKMKCYGDPARVNGLVRESRLRGNFNPRLAARPLMPPKRGRPKHGEHVCEECGRKVATAQKKRDHQKRCKPKITIIEATKDINPHPNLLELAKCSRYKFTKDNHGHDVVQFQYSQERPHLSE